MKSLNSSGLVLAIAGFVAVLGTWGEARSSSESSPTKIVIGEVAQVKGEFHMAQDPPGQDTLDIVDKSYVITDQAGDEIRLDVDPNTKVRNRINPGDKIEAEISSKGQTLSVTRLDP
jgi:hypothetical protein